jgi:hypothetical protein
MSITSLRYTEYVVASNNEIEKHVRESTYHGQVRINVETWSEPVRLVEEFDNQRDKNLIATRERLLTAGRGVASKVVSTGYHDWIDQVQRLSAKMELLCRQKQYYVKEATPEESSEETSEEEDIGEPVLLSSSDDGEPLPKRLSKA